MVKLNLLPEKIRAAERLRLVVILGVLVYGLAVASLGWLWIGKRAKLTEAQARVDAVNAELNSPQLQETVKAVEKFTKDQDEMKTKASVVNAVRKRQATIARLVDTMPDWTLDGLVWFDNFTLADTRKATIDGFAPAGLAFARFYTQMETQVGISGLKLESVSTVKERDQDVTKFRISFTVEEFQ